MEFQYLNLLFINRLIILGGQDTEGNRQLVAYAHDRLLKGLERAVGHQSVPLSWKIFMIRSDHKDFPSAA